MIKNHKNIFIAIQKNPKGDIHVIPALDDEWRPIPIVEITDLIEKRALRAYGLFMRSDVLKTIAHTISVGNWLTQISFKKINFIVKDCHDAIVEFATILRQNSFIERLMFDECKMRPETMTDFLRKLTGNKNLAHLIIKNQQLWLPAVEALRDSLVSEIRLTTLNLIDDQLSD